MNTNMIDEMKKLINELNIYSYEYYVLDNPSMTDKIYDQKYDQLVEMERNTGKILPSSPTQRVGDRTLEGFRKVKHKNKLWSLDKAQEYDEIRKFINNVEKASKEANIVEPIVYVLMKKLDGLTLNSTYINTLELSATRGTGLIGEDCTEQSKLITNQPLSIDYNQSISIHGEVIMTKKSFEEYNRDAKEPLKNLRNGASGAIRNLNLAECKKRKLSIIYYDITDTIEIFENHSDKLDFIKKLGIPCIEYVLCSSYDEIIKEIERIEDERSHLQYDIDGVVIRVNNLKLCKYMGYTVKFPKFAIAYKFEAEETTTILEGVEWNVGRTGRVNPTANVKPVELMGVTVKRATLNNMDDIRKKGIKIGSEIVIRRSNDVIPEILGVTLVKTETKEILPPDKCPDCGSPLILDGAYYYCDNTLGCKSQLIKSIAHFTKREAMDIVGVSEKTIEALINRGILNTVKDLYDLEDKKEEILTIEKFGLKKYEKLIKSINKSRECELYRLIYGLNILNVGEKTAKDICNNLKTLGTIRNASVDDFLNIDDIGRTIAVDIFSWFKNETNLALLDELVRELKIKEVEDITIKENIFLGKTVVATGTLENYSRTGIKGKLESLGAKISGSVSKKTDYVIVGDNVGSKYDKAMELGVNILTEKEFEDML